MSKRRPSPRSSSTPAGARSPAGRTWRRTGARAGGSARLCLAGGGAWWLLAGRTARSASGVDLGRLSAGGSADRLNLLVITLDTTRADRIGAYGYQDIETPTIDRLAREGVLFEQTMADGAADAAGPLLHLHRDASRPSTACATTAVSSSSPAQLTLADDPQARRAFARAPSSARTCSTASGASTRDSTPTSTTSTCRSCRGFASAMSSGPGNEVVDRALPWLEKVKGAAVLRLAAFLRSRTRPYDAARAVQDRATPSTRTSARSPSWTRRSRA